jgi:hypothetical protein
MVDPFQDFELYVCKRVTGPPRTNLRMSLKNLALFSEFVNQIIEAIRNLNEVISKNQLRIAPLH